MVMMSSLLFMAVLVLVPFLLASARYVVVRTGRPDWLRRVLAARTPRHGLGVGASVADELHAFLNSAKRVQIEHRVEEQVLKDDAPDGAPPRMGVDLDAGTAVFHAGPVPPPSLCKRADGSRGA
ncbi:DUF6191 domain-containing protein [Streptomyces sp. NPDC051020]|uniref:DUF6191 domain-containing protein n=1 Tax=Streptomyces sp. NPDC051020 TaxID=3155409 RepID=UPI003439D11E